MIEDAGIAVSVTIGRLVDTSSDLEGEDGLLDDPEKLWLGLAFTLGILILELLEFEDKTSMLIAAATIQAADAPPQIFLMVC